jgi:hypothetical protein
VNRGDTDRCHWGNGAYGSPVDEPRCPNRRGGGTRQLCDRHEPLWQAEAKRRRAKRRAAPRSGLSSTGNLARRPEKATPISRTGSPGSKSEFGDGDVVRRKLLSVFAHAIWAKAKEMRELGAGTPGRRRLLESLSDDIRKYSDLVPPAVSLAAQAEAARLGVDLRQMGWHDQPRFDPGRRIFHWEHVHTVSSIRSLCLEASSATQVEEHLDKVRVAWILKVEDLTLTALGFRSRRSDADEAYRAAGIVLT